MTSPFSLIEQNGEHIIINIQQQSRQQQPGPGELAKVGYAKFKCTPLKGTRRGFPSRQRVCINNRSWFQKRWVQPCQQRISTSLPSREQEQMDLSYSYLSFQPKWSRWVLNNSNVITVTDLAFYTKTHTRLLEANSSLIPRLLHQMLHFNMGMGIN